MYNSKSASGLKRRYQAKVLSQPAKKQVSKIVEKKIHANEEDKYFDLKQIIASGTAATDNAGSVVLMSGVQQGITFDKRIGEVINASKFEFRFDCNPILNGAGGGNPLFTNLRVIMFQDRQIRTSTLPALTDVLETAVYNSPLNHYNINSKRFKILVDKIFEMDPYLYNPTAGSQLVNITPQTSQRMMKKIKLKGKICYTNPTTGTERNNIYVLYLSDQATAQAPAVNLYSRLIFEDA